MLELLQKVARTFARVLKFGRLAGSLATLADFKCATFSDSQSLQPFLAVLELWRTELQFCSPAKSVLQRRPAVLELLLELLACL